MTAIITWAITKMDCYPEIDNETDVVFNVHWSCSGVQTEGDTTYNGSAYGTQTVTIDAGAPFTPYDQLTQEQVLGWVWAAGVNKDMTETAVQLQINNQINPPVVTPPLPWTN